MIQIRISDDAVADLDEGFGFNENQEAGLVTISPPHSDRRLKD